MPGPDNIRTTPRQIRTERAREWVNQSLQHCDSESLANRDAERAVIGSMLLEQRAIDAACAGLPDGRLELLGEHERWLWDVLVALHQRSDHPPIDGLLIREEMQRTGIWEKAGGYESLSGYVNAVPSAARITYYAGLVHRCYQRRRLVEIARGMMQCAMDSDYSPESAMSVGLDDLLTFGAATCADEGMQMLNAMAETFRTLGNDQRLLGQPTGFGSLDEMTCGWQPADLILIAGRTSVGKTAFGLQCAMHLGISLRLPALYFSLEMSRQAIGLRAVSAISGVPLWKIRRRRLDLTDNAALATAEEIANQAMARDGLWINDASSLRIDQLAARAHLHKARHGLVALFVDYLQLLSGKAQQRYERREREIADISSGLKALAKDLAVPLIATCQLNRGPESRVDKRPRLSDLREGGTQEQDADLVILLHPEGGYEQREEWKGPYTSGSIVSPNLGVECILAKQRSGPTGLIKLDWNPETMTFSERKV